MEEKGLGLADVGERACDLLYVNPNPKPYLFWGLKS